jgi:DNA-binding NarL/FixJ family response regulator
LINYDILIRIILFEDNEDFIDSLTELIKGNDNMELCAAYRNSKDVVRHIQYYKPDIVIMDIDMPVQNGLEGLRSIRAAELDVIVLMLTVFDDNDRVFQSVCNGASGYLLKTTSPERIVECIREAYHGGAPMTPSVAKQVLKLFSMPFQKSEDLQKLTPREHDVLSLLVRGFSYKMAASEMEISIETLRYHVKNIYAKLHVNSKSEAVAKAIHNRIN